MKRTIIGAAGLLLISGLGLSAAHAQTQASASATTSNGGSATVSSSTTTPSDTAATASSDNTAYTYGDNYNGSNRSNYYRFNDTYGGASDRPWHGGPADANIAMTWSGGVDNTAEIRFQGSNVSTHVVEGHDVLHPNYHIETPLPDHHVHVFLTHVSGRGTVDIEQQPNRDNGYTAVVRIHDPQPGTGDYHFALAWQ